MAASVTHATTATGTDAGTGEIHKAQWNADHTVSGVALTSHSHAGSDITSGTVAEGNIDSAIARDSEVSGAISTHAGIATAHGTFANASHSHSAGDLPDLDSLTGPSADVAMNSHKITGLADPGSNQDAATKKYVDDGISGGVTFATPTVALGSSAAAGAAGSTIRSDSTIAAFDGTTPANVGTAATGSAAFAARRDHIHGTGAGTPSTQVLGDAAATGTGPAAAMTDHKHALSASNASATLSGAVTMVNAGTFYDGPTLTLAAGTWLVSWQIGCKVIVATSQTYVFTAKLWDGSSTIWDEAEDTLNVANANCSGYHKTLSGAAIVVLGGSSTVKISATGIRSSSASEISRDVTDSSGSSHTASLISAVRIA